jgi:hypothetical protein
VVTICGPCLIATLRLPRSTTVCDCHWCWLLLHLTHGTQAQVGAMPVGQSVARGGSPSREFQRTMERKKERAPAAIAWGWLATAVCMAHLTSGTTAQASPSTVPTPSPTGQSITPMDCTNLLVNGNFEQDNLTDGFVSPSHISGFSRGAGCECAVA